MSNLPNTESNIRIYQNEYVSNITLNRPLQRLLKNDLYLENIVKNYLNKPILPFYDTISPPVYPEKSSSKEWIVGSAVNDRALTINVVIDDGDNFRQSILQVLNNNNTIEISDTFHESPHTVANITIESYIKNDNIYLKVVSGNQLKLQIMAEVTVTIPKNITRTHASRYAWYLKQDPAANEDLIRMFSAHHAHIGSNGVGNLDALSNIEANPNNENKFLYLNKQGNYTPVIINTPTNHNHEHLDLLERINDDQKKGVIETINGLSNTGSKYSFLAEDGKYYKGSIHKHNNLNALDTIINTGPTDMFLNAAGEYEKFDISLLHAHSPAEFTNLSTLALISPDKLKLIDNLDIDDDTETKDESQLKYLSLYGDYVKVHTHDNLNNLGIVEKTGYDDDRYKYLSKEGSYVEVKDMVHKHSNSGILNAIGTGEKYQFLNGKGVYTSIDTDLAIGSTIIWCGDANNIPDNFLPMNGAAILRSIFSELYHTIGTRYGNGNGTTTFNLPYKPEKSVIINEGEEDEYEIFEIQLIKFTRGI